ncbi:hypothetical protein [Bradyrhizobium sp. USDA 3397]
MKRRLQLVVICQLLVTVLIVDARNSTACADDGSIIADYKQRMSAHILRMFEAIPLYGANYSVGDIWHPSMRRLLEKGVDCFPTLSLLTRPYAQTEAFRISGEASLGLVLRAQKLFGFQTKASDSAQVMVQFEDVVEELASEGDLQRGFSRQRCERFEAVISGSKIPADQIAIAGSNTSDLNQVPVIIGRLYRGKRRIVVSYKSEGDLKVKAEQILQAVGAPVTGAIEVALSGSKSLVVVDREPVPLAFAPAFIPVRVSGATMGSQSTGSIEYEWVPFNPVKAPWQKAALTDLADKVEEGWAWEEDRTR